jgi:hypothetical protein
MRVSGRQRPSAGRPLRAEEEKVMKKETLLRAAIAGLGLGLAVTATGTAGEKPGEVKCYGVNGCGSHAKCAVSAADIEAVRRLLGESDFQKRFGKSEAHSCGAHAKCGGAAQILNWLPASAGECKAQGGILIEEREGKKVAKKA